MIVFIGNLRSIIDTHYKQCARSVYQEGASYAGVVGLTLLKEEKVDHTAEHIKNLFQKMMTFLYMMHMQRNPTTSTKLLMQLQEKLQRETETQSEGHVMIELMKK